MPVHQKQQIKKSSYHHILSSTFFTPLFLTPAERFGARFCCHDLHPTRMAQVDQSLQFPHLRFRDSTRLASSRQRFVSSDSSEPESTISSDISEIQLHRQIPQQGASAGTLQFSSSAIFVLSPFPTTRDPKWDRSPLAAWFSCFNTR